MDFLSALLPGVDWQLLAYAPPGWGKVLLQGLLNSLIVAGGGYALGLLLGVGGAMAKLRGGPVARDLAEAYTTIVRGMPELILILILYYLGTDLLNRALALMGVGRVQASGLVAGISVIAIVQGAYATEVIRGAIQAIAPGEHDAAQAFGMSARQALWRITLPGMLPFAIPGLANLWLIATKDTALLAVAGFTELTLATRQAAGTTKAYLLFFCAAGLLYLAITLLSNQLFAALERRARRGQRPEAARG